MTRVAASRSMPRPAARSARAAVVDMRGLFLAGAFLDCGLRVVGFLVVTLLAVFLVEEEGWALEAALKAFADARPPGIYSRAPAPPVPAPPVPVPVPAPAQVPQPFPAAVAVLLIPVLRPPAAADEPPGVR